MAIFLALMYVAVHGVVLVLFPAHAQVLSLTMLTTAPIVAGFACAWRAMRGGLRAAWWALAFGMWLWAGGMGVTMIMTVLDLSPDGLSGLATLLFVLYGVPLTFALASPEREIWYLRVIDAVLALVLGYLFFVHTFTFAQTDQVRAEGMQALRLMFDVENVFIALFALVRFAASVSPVRRSLFARLLAFACVYLVTAAYINHFQHESPYGAMADVLIDVPFLLLAVLALRRPAADAPPRPSTWFAHAVRVGSPLMLPISMLVVSGFIVSSHPWLAITGFVVAFVGYGLRSVLSLMRSLDRQRQLDELARVDPLTGLSNRRQFDETLQREWLRARRAGTGLALLMIDIDHFKRINDAYGHQSGDEHLRTVGRSLAANLGRPGDLVARYGGEEFVVLLPDCTAGGALQVAERMRAAIESLRLPAPPPGEVVTVSIGVGSVHIVAADDGPRLIESADAALYQAKNDGRNRVASRVLL